jgi:hypothetical protein
MGCLLGTGLIFTGCSPQSKPPEAAQTEPGPDAVDEGPDETTVALEEKLANCNAPNCLKRVGENPEKGG